MKYFRSGQYPIEFVLTENINKEFSSHNHAQHYIISLCIKGSVTATLENKSLQIKENDFFTVPPFMPHAVSLTDTSVLVSLCMDKSFVEDYSSQKDIKILEMLFFIRVILSSLLLEPAKILFRDSISNSFKVPVLSGYGAVQNKTVLSTPAISIFSSEMSTQTKARIASTLYQLYHFHR